ncbi:beta-microseminoprotein-like isoform X1 [Cetorhinus maximus]
MVAADVAIGGHHDDLNFVTLKLKNKNLRQPNRTEIRLSVTVKVSRWAEYASQNCRDDVDGTWHAHGENWINSDCMGCSCSVESMSCCTTYGTPTVYPDDCIAVFDRENCQYRVHKKNDTSVECRVYASVG